MPSPEKMTEKSFILIGSYLQMQKDCIIKKITEKSFERFIQIKENNRLKGLHIMIDEGCKSGGGTNCRHLLLTS